MGLGFLKKGAAAHKLIDKAEAETEARRAAAQNSVRRYWIPEGKEGQITFLDGGLDDSGLLDTTAFWEHNLKLGGHWRNWFPCTQVEEPCPICEGGENPYLVSLFTVIDHSEYTDKNGKTHKNERRLFAAKRETFRRLQKIAAKRGGLTGITFDVSRTGDKSASVGDTFDFVEKRTLNAIAKAYSLTKEDVQPFVYDDVIEYRDAKALRKAGFGAGGVNGDGDEDDDAGVGGEDASEVKKKAAAKKAAQEVDEYEDEV